MGKLYLKHSIISLCLLFQCINSFGQRKLLNKFLSNEKDTTRSSSFLPLPAVAYSQETGLEFGIVSLYSFYTDRRDTLIRNSSITGVATVTTRKQLNLQLKTDIWAPANKYHYQAELRYKNFPFNFYGIGSNTREADMQLLTQKSLRLSADIEKRLSKLFYTGVNIGFDHYSFSYMDEQIFTNNPHIEGKNGGKILFAGLSQIFDSRNSNTYPTKGLYIRLNYSYAPNFFGKDNFSGSLLKFDLRQFKSLSPKAVMGYQINYQTLQGNGSPFYLLPQLGNDQIMRGYYSGRYRDQNLLALQTELRYRFSPRFGMAGFMGLGKVYKNGQFTKDQLKPSYGGGFRYFFDVERGLSVRMDYGVGEKRPGEKRQTGMYISLAEAF